MDPYIINTVLTASIWAFIFLIIREVLQLPMYFIAIATGLASLCTVKFLMVMGYIT